MQAKPQEMYLPDYLQALKPRSADWHKGLSGHVLIIGGDLGYSGAPRMAAQAALRVGAGLVTVATQVQHVNSINVAYPEIMCKGIQDIEELSPLMQKASVIVIGPGLGQSAWSHQLWEYVMQSDKPMLVDADALNLLAQKPTHKENWVLTPHAGEAGRLLQMTNTQIQAQRLVCLQALQQQYGGTCVLKGAGSLVLSSQGLPAICTKGNPGMATAGMGDILSGVIGGLMAQGLNLDLAAKLGVLIHATAGDLAAKNGERGMIASDLLPFIRQLVNETHA